MPPPDAPDGAGRAPDPLERLAARQRRLRACAGRLLVLGTGSLAPGPDAGTPDTARAVLKAFDVEAPHLHDVEAHELFPALLESMAGSDPVCLRGITEALRAGHRELAVKWRALRPAVARLAAGVPGPWPQADVAAFVALQHALLDREAAELLPLAARLLDDDALARLGRALGPRVERE